MPMPFFFCRFGRGPPERCGSLRMPAIVVAPTWFCVAMKLKDGWQIVAKSYRYDLRDQFRM
jgi:hypothetical protein